MAYLAHTVLILCCTATGVSVAPLNQATTSGKVEKDHRVSMVINPHGPVTIQDASIPPLAGKLTKTIRRTEPSYIQKSAKETSTVTVFGDSDCREKEFELSLSDSRDWTSSCYTVGLETTDATSKLKTEAKKVKKENEASANSSALIQTHPAKVQAKITCDENGAIVIYNENDDGCMNHASRFLLDKDQATLARSGKCLTADAEIHDKDEGAVSIQFRNVDENTVFPECFKESSIPLPSELVAFVGPEKAWYFIVGVSAAGFIVVCWLLYWAWKMCAPKKEWWEEGSEYQMMKGQGKGGYPF